MVDEKLCVGCDVVRPAADFHRDLRASTGLHSRCKECYRRWHAANKAKVLANQRQYRERRKSEGARKDRKFYDRVKTSLWVRFRSRRYKAVREGHGWSLTIEAFAALSELPCTYCGLTFDRGTGSGLDRVDCSRGYTTDNVVPCCAVCNRVKLDVFTRDEMTKIGAVVRDIILARRSLHES
jgi:hypothetical protein